MRPLFLAALMTVLLIHAEGPLPADPREAIEAARALAIALGCLRPAVAVQWRGEGQGMEITVRCLGDGEHE